MRCWLACAVMFVVSLSGAATTAAAQDVMPEVVLVVIAECAESPLDAALLTERLRVELTSDGVRETRLCAPDDPALSAARPGLAIVRITHAPCAVESATFVVQIDDFVTRKRVERTLDLDETAAEARLRALALATGELLRASWAELAVTEPPTPAPQAMLAGVAMRVRVRALGVTDAPSLVTPPPDVASPPDAGAPNDDGDDARRPSRRLSTSIGAAFVVRAFPSAAIAPLGGRASFELTPLDALVVRLDLEAAVATSLADPLGAIDIGLATAGLTLAYAAALGATTVFSVGPQVSVGAAWANGRARSAATLEDSGVGPVVLIGAAAQLDVQLVAGCSARFGLDLAGTALAFEARVRDVPSTGIMGASLGVWAGLALAP